MIAVVLLFLMMMALGMGNGSVFQIVPSRFPTMIGLATGVVGAAGGLGGFLLPIALGSIRDFTGSYGPGLRLFGLFGVIGLFCLNGGRLWMWVRAGSPIYSMMPNLRKKTANIERIQGKRGSYEIKQRTEAVKVGPITLGDSEHNSEG